LNKLTEFSNDKIFSRLLKNKSSENYWKYISELRKRKTEDIFDKAVELTKSEVSKEKIIGINILAQFGYPRLHLKEISSAFFRLLKIETDKNIISSLLYGIGHNNEKLTEKQIETICSYKNHKSANVRHSLVSSLLAIEKTKAIDTLIELSKDKDSDVRDWATFGLGTQIKLDNELIREALWNRTNDKDVGTRDEAIFGLAKRKDKRIKEILKRELENIDEFGSLILESIEEFNDKDFINLIEKQIIKNKELKKINEEWLENTLEKLKETK
jgi:HEAT repeat protein